jgi:hypothetical protein
MTLPSSSDQNSGGTMILILWLTSDAIEDLFVDLKTGRPVKKRAILMAIADDCDC